MGVTAISRRDGTVWIAEDLEPGDDGLFCTGTFRAHLDRDDAVADSIEEVSADEAIAWGRARADRVYIRLAESDYFAAGAVEHPEFPGWPPRDLPPLVRRRVSNERWKDRTPDDASIEWQVDVRLLPHWVGPDLRSRRAEWCATVSEIAERAGAASWSSEPLDGFLRDAERASDRDSNAFYTPHEPALTLTFRVHASTMAEAAADATSTIELPADWTLSAQVEPATSG